MLKWKHFLVKRNEKVLWGQWGAIRLWQNEQIESGFFFELAAFYFDGFPKGATKERKKESGNYKADKKDLNFFSFQVVSNQQMCRFIKKKLLGKKLFI